MTMILSILLVLAWTALTFEIVAHTGESLDARSRNRREPLMPAHSWIAGFVVCWIALMTPVWLFLALLALNIITLE